MEKEEFAKLVIASEQSLYRVAKSILREEEDCKDAVQEAIACGFSKLTSLKKDEYAKTWLTRILINECYHIVKKRSRFTELDQCLLESESETGYDYSDLYEALGSLKKEFRVVLVLYYVEEFSIKEIAKCMKLPAGTVKSRLSRGRKQLRLKLDGMGEMKYERYQLERKLS